MKMIWSAKQLTVTFQTAGGIPIDDDRTNRQKEIQKEW